MCPRVAHPRVVPHLVGKADMGPGGYDAQSERSLRVRAPTVQVGDPYPGAGQPGNAGRSRYHF